MARIDRSMMGAALIAVLTVAGAVLAERPTGEITLVSARDVRAAFERGAPLVETPSYKIHASRRDAPGMAEIHVRDTDTIHVIEGRAVFVVGGSVVGAKPTSPDEIRGSAIDGGRTLNLGPGDVVAVPAGTPHWFREVDPPFLYYVVKVTEGR